MMKTNSVTVVAIGMVLGAAGVLLPGVGLARGEAKPSATAVARSAPAKLILTLEAARAAIEGAKAAARERAGTGAIVVVDDGGAVLAAERLDGTFAASSEVAIGKARTAAIFRKPTRVFEESINGGRTAMTSMHGYVFLQGGVPIVMDGSVVGAVGVSGAASAKEDEELAEAGASAAGGSK